MSNIKEIEKCIEENLKTKSSSIDLSRCKLTGNEEVLKELAKVKHLYHIKLQDNIITNTDFLSNLNFIERLYLANNQISDISFLTQYSNLKHLDLSNNLVQDYTPISKMKRLQGLFLSRNNILEYSFIEHLTTVQSLSLFENKIEDISFLKNLKILTYLNVECNKIKDISALKGLKHLQRLNICSNEISSISLDFLNELPRLEELFLDKNPVKNIPTELFDKRENVLDSVIEYLEYIEKRNQLIYLINETEYYTFFDEVRNLNKQNAEVSRLKKRFIHDGGGYEFPEQLKVWVLHNFQ
ncbi:leucine-rich repeat domain-containing protein [Bernardetia sp. OM2101]|uniref:leucine-rich repeat domain-containing protein n=1 Tax=Bernardetia sp. OM2101 TaxID=3344876 RepID=UPI0035D0B0F5